MITGGQIRAGRKLLGWSQLKLALEASVSTRTLLNIEMGRSRPLFSGSKLRTALEAAGVEFPDGEPPRVKRAQ